MENMTNECEVCNMAHTGNRIHSDSKQFEKKQNNVDILQNNFNQIHNLPHYPNFNQQAPSPANNNQQTPQPQPQPNQNNNSNSMLKQVAPLLNGLTGNGGPDIGTLLNAQNGNMDMSKIINAFNPGGAKAMGVDNNQNSNPLANLSSNPLASLLTGGLGGGLGGLGGGNPLASLLGGGLGGNNPLASLMGTPPTGRKKATTLSKNKPSNIGNIKNLTKA